jgi:ribosomal protein S18 acetylase RimI-like enzyme
MSKESVRELKATDKESILALIKAEKNFTEDERECAVELLDIYLEDPEQDDYLFRTVVDSADTPLGYICYGEASLSTTSYEVYWILVNDKARGRGLGRMLLDDVEGILKGKGVKSIIAETSGQPTYAPTHAFYTALGFTEEARLKDYYKLGDDKIFFTKRLA